MPAINANIVVDTTTLTLSPTTTTVGVTVDPINLSVYATGVAQQNPPGGTIGQLQYNAGSNVFGGLANANVASGTLTFSNLANLKIDGGSAGYQLTTDGAGVLSWTSTSNPTRIVNGTSNVEIASVDGNVDFTVGSANVARMSTTGAAYPGVLAVNGNITAQNDITVASGASFVGDGNGISWTDASNVNINGGTNGYVLGTDGAGSLTWVAQGGAGTGNPGGSNTNIQFNDAGLFGGNIGFTFDNSTGIVNMPTDLVVANDITASTGLLTVADANVTNVLTANTLSLTNLNIVGTTSIHEAIEDVQLISVPTGTYNYDVLDGSIQYPTADATSDLVLNFRGNATTTFNTFLDTGKSFTGTYVMTNGTTAYQITSIEIDSVSATINWASGFAPLPTASSLNSYTFTVIKTSASPTYTVLASLTGYS